MSNRLAQEPRNAMALPVVHVAVGVVQREDGRVLLAERPRGKVSEGYWEFPGGKFEIAETARQALARELHEELGVELDAAFPWLTYEYAYADKTVRLHFYRVLAWHGTPHGREGQRVSWEDPQAVAVGPLMPANDRALNALNLPPVYAITAAARFGIAGFMPRLEQALERGVRLLQVRERKLSSAQLTQFARRVVAMARGYDARVLVNGDETLALRSGADGVHLTAQQLMRLRRAPATGMWAASCHDAAELARATEFHADLAVLSPVLPTATHPDTPGMGWPRFEQLARDSAVPIYALGGMRPELLEQAMHHGAHGVALFSGIW